jgi:hypothetical protein
VQRQSLQVHPEWPMATIETEGRENYGSEEDNRTQDGAHDAQNCTQDSAHGTQNWTQDGAHGTQNWTQDGAHDP